MVSVIIPTYNRQLFLDQAIDSVLQQSEPCGEIVIVDDGSTDDTRLVVERKAAGTTIPIRYFFQENKGAAAARNLGIKKAREKYICFLDSDDYFDPGKIKYQKKVLEESGNIVSHTEEKWLRRGQHLNKKKKHHPPDGYIFAQCLPMCLVGMSTVMACRQLFDKHGFFDESLPCCEDYDFWLRVSTVEKFKLVSLPLTIKNGGREDQLSVIHRVGMDRFRIRSLVNLLENISLTPEQYDLALDELERKCNIYGKGCLKHGRTDEGHRYLQIPARFQNHAV